MHVNRKRREDGAILILTALMLLVLIGAAAIAVDLSGARSERRDVQGAADVAAISALQAIPRTYVTTIGDVPGAAVAVSDLVTTLTATNSPGSGILSNVDPDWLGISVTVNGDFDAAFGRAISDNSQINIPTSASARIEVETPDRLFPFGFESPTGQPYQCLESDAPHPVADLRVCKGFEDAGTGGKQHRLLKMHAAVPEVCTDPAPPTTPFDTSLATQWRFGVDHRIEVGDGITVRTEELACTDGHLLTLPTEANTRPFNTDNLTDTFAGHAAFAAEDPLWTHLLPGNVNNCQRGFYDDPLLTLEEKSNHLRNCLQGWNSASGPIFEASVTGSARFGFAVDIDEDDGDPNVFEAEVMLYLHLIVSDEPEPAAPPPPDPPPPPPDPGDPPEPPEPAWGIYLTYPFPAEDIGSVGAVTMYAIQPGMLSASTYDALVTPFGIDDIEFFVTE